MSRTMKSRDVLVRTLGLTAFASGLVLLLACGGDVASTTVPPAPATAAATGVGDACTPSVEASASFGSFSEREVVIESESPQCKTGVCLVNHFRGRVTCPYGQDVEGKAPSGASPCALADGGGVAPDAGRRKNQVSAQCLDRTAAKAVYCSCRCANAEGKTDDGATYCGCSSGFACTQLVSSIGSKAEQISGGYCMKAGTAYDAANACAAVFDPSIGPCP